MAVDVLDRPPAKIRPDRRGALPPPDASAGGGEPGGGGGLADPALFGLWLFLGTLSMLFVGFTSAYMVRRTGSDWRPLPLPGWLWANTAALLASSATLEVARRRLRGWDLPGAQRWAAATGVLGALFLAGQFAAWRALADAGYFLATNAHNSFFFLLTGLHGLHLVSALIWFGVVYVRLRALALVPGVDGLRRFATYWHFLAGLWLYLLALLYLA